MVKVPENYEFDEQDYWDLRENAILKLSLPAYEEAIRFGQKYGYKKAKFDLALKKCSLSFTGSRIAKIVISSAMRKVKTGSPAMMAKI